MAETHGEGVRWHVAEQNDSPASSEHAPDAPTDNTATHESGPLFARVARVHSYLDLTDEEEDAPPGCRGRVVIAAVCGVLLIAIVGAVVLLGGSNHNSKPPLASGTVTAPSGPLSATVPEGMPSHFAFGLMSASGDVGLMNDMRAQNGAAWDLRYVALTGGVTGGHGWETQGSPAGAYALTYADDSSANRYTPAFAYEELAQTVGSCQGCDARHADLRNLNDPAIMAAYFANWRLLMQRLGAFGRPALVIVEPGLWGYLQQAAYNQGNTASAIPAAVASSSDQDAAGMPDTAQGFAWTLLHIRDRYAPNAILTLHFSNWSTGSDINSSPSVALDVAGVATRTAQFLNSAGLANTPGGVSTWDLLSNDVSGQDSGQGAVWWDATNKVYPNFARYLQFVSLVSHDTGRKVVLWQVPEGNQYFDTMNNSAHHTQDNRAQYLLGHVGDFANAGVIAALFGTGGGGTTVDDVAGDGVTNPTPISSFGCDRCNNHVSDYADDDGGYLRVFVGAYYRHGPLKLASPQSWTPPPAPGSAIATPPPAGTCVGTPIARVGQTSANPNPARAGGGVSVTTTVTLNCNTSVLLDVEVDGNQGRVVHMTRDNVVFQQNQPRTLTVQGIVPVGTPAGAYVIKVGVFEAGWGALEGWSDGSATLVVR